MCLNEARQVGPHMLKHRSDLVVMLLDLIMPTPITTCHSETFQIDQMALESIECMMNCILKELVTILRVTMNHHDRRMTILFLNELVLLLDRCIHGERILLRSFGLYKLSNDLDGSTNAELYVFANEILHDAQLIRVVLDIVDLIVLCLFLMFFRQWIAYLLKLVTITKFFLDILKQLLLCEHFEFLFSNLNLIRIIIVKCL